MSQHEKDGAAFPHLIPGDVTTGDLFSQGMSMRDYFAAKAMQSLIATDNYGSAARVCAKDAYEFADAMLGARQST